MWPFRTRPAATIELSRFERLHELERRVWYSPVAIGLGLLAIGAAGYTFWNLKRGLLVEPQHMFVGYGAFLILYFSLLAYIYAYRFPRLKCPGCGKCMPACVADTEEGGWRSVVYAVEINGRFYRQPLDEDDRRPWIRVMRMVRACSGCQTFVDCARFHFETCSEDELYEIERRAAGW
jgi:ferredoxin